MNIIKSVKHTIAVLLAAFSPIASHAQIYDTNDDVVEIVAGSGTSGMLNGLGTQSMFADPLHIVSDTSSNLYVMDINNGVIRKISPDNNVSTFASIVAPGKALGIGGMAIDSKSTIWMTTGVYGPSGIYQVGSDGSINLLSFGGITQYSGICIDSADNIYYTAGNQVFRISTLGVQSVWAGNTASGAADGNGLFALFNNPGALAVDQAGNVYVWDAGNNKIRRIDRNQNVTTVAGSGASAAMDGVGFNASFNGIGSMCVDNSGNVIMACGSCIRKMTATTNIVTMAGSFSQNSYANGAGSLARFNGAWGVCISHGNLFVADSGNNRIRSISFNPQPQPVSGANLVLNVYPGLTITGLVGRTYQIQASTDLENWSEVVTILLTSSPYLWFDQNAVNQKRFYRAWLIP